MPNTEGQGHSSAVPAREGAARSRSSTFEQTPSFHQNSLSVSGRGRGGAQPVPLPRLGFTAGHPWLPRSWDSASTAGDSGRTAPAGPGTAAGAAGALEPWMAPSVRPSIQPGIATGIACGHWKSGKFLQGGNKLKLPAGCFCFLSFPSLSIQRRRAPGAASSP